MSDYPGGWFGDSWGAPVCDPRTHKPTPVGDECVDCKRMIKPGDQGMIIPVAEDPPWLSAYHWECFMRLMCPPGLRDELDRQVFGRLVTSEEFRGLAGSMTSAETGLAALEELLGKQEELDPELAAYVDPDGPLGPALRHPLVYNISQHPQMNAMMNATLRHKREALRRAITGRHWNTVVFLHERPWRIDAFSNYCWRMGDRSYWDLLGHIYVDTENLWQNYDLWVDCLTAERRYRSHLMTPEDRVALRQDHDKVITVYRGWSERGTGEHGLSWTTSSTVAKFFARRLAGDGDQQYVATGQVKKRDVLGFFDTRREQEILVLPGSVYGIETREVTNHST